MHVYTDASKSSDSLNVGIGIVIHEEDMAYSMTIDKRCSVFTAELLGLERAIGYAYDNEWMCDVVIFSDSQAAIKEIKKLSLNVRKSKITCAFKEKLAKYCERVKVVANKEVKVVVG